MGEGFELEYDFINGPWRAGVFTMVVIAVILVIIAIYVWRRGGFEDLEHVPFYLDTRARARLQRKLRLTIIVFIFIIAFFPIPHQYESEEELVQTLEINTYLSDGESLSDIWNLKGVNIVRINISCSKDILVHLIDKKALKGQEYKGLLAKVSKVHEYDYRANITSVMEVKVLNPAWIEDGPAVPRVRGSIEAYRITKSVWLPWWWPIITRARS